jgi:hypothetical protein
VLISEPRPLRLRDVGEHPRTVSGFADTDGDDLTYAYRWTGNDVPIGTDSSTLALDTAGRGDRIAVQVVAHDGHGGSSATVTHAVTRRQLRAGRGFGGHRAVRPQDR